MEEKDEDEDEEEELKGEEDDGEDEEEVSFELNESEAGSQQSTRQSTPNTTASSDTAATVATSSDEDDIGWARDPALKLGTLEELRGNFNSELKDPSAWVLQRLAALTNASSDFGPREAVRLWYWDVIYLTGTPTGEPLRLPPVVRPGNTPFHRVLTWEEANQFGGQARESSFWEVVDEGCKRAARLSIDFLITDARTKGLSTGDKKRLYIVASSVWRYDRFRAEGLLWVVKNEYRYTRPGHEREWANEYSEEFMVHTVLYPPPIVLTW